MAKYWDLENPNSSATSVIENLLILEQGGRACEVRTDSHLTRPRSVPAVIAGSRQHRLDDLAVDVSESEIPALVPEGQPFVVESERR